MIGTKWAPSEIENTLYDIMEDYEIGVELYQEEVVEEISNYFSTLPNVQWQLGCTAWQNDLGGVCYVSFIDNGTLHQIGFDYKKGVEL